MQLVTTGIMAGPDGLFDRGSVIDVPEITAKRLQSLGQAMTVTDYQKKHKKWNPHEAPKAPPMKKANEADEQAWLEEQAVRQSGVDNQMQFAAALNRLADILELLETKLK